MNPSVAKHLKRVQDLSGSVFGSLLAVKQVGQNTKNQWIWECLCECGKTVLVVSDSLRRGHTQSCGCLRLKRLRESITTHGHAAQGDHSITYTTWQVMLQRCENPKNPAYPEYGGKGITVCERWHTFEHFLKDMGERPSMHYSIDRISNNWGYDPSNCRWATKKEQQRNRADCHFVTAFGETRTIAEWTEISHLSFSTISGRLKAGWNPEDAVSLPPSPKKYKNRQ